MSREKPIADTAKTHVTVRHSLKPRLCSRHLLRLENPCYPAEAGFHGFGPQHIDEYACGPKPFQLRGSQWFPTPRYDAYCTIWVKGKR